MAGTYHTQFSLRGVTLEAVRDLYLDWVLGLGASAKVRERRLATGILPEWTRATLADDVVHLHGADDAEVELRFGLGQFVLLWTHREPARPDVTWKSVVRLRHKGEIISIEHGTRCSVPYEPEFDVTPRPPSVLEVLLALPGATVEPSDFGAGTPALVPADDVPRFVEAALLRSDRSLPLVVVAPRKTPDTGEETFLVDPQALATRLLGLANVALLSDTRASFAFTEALGARGFEKGLSCFDGGVRCYRPDLATRRERHAHRLWLGNHLASIGVEAATREVVHSVATTAARRGTPRDLWSAVMTFERERLAYFGTLVKKGEQQIAEYEQLASLALAEGDLELKRVREDLAEVDEQRQRAEYALCLAEDARDAALREIDVLKHHLDAKYATSHAKALAARHLRPELREALKLALRPGARLTPTQCLLVAEAVCGVERLIVLDEAWKSAEEARDFEHGGQLLQQLLTLGFEYVDALRAGKGDVEARRCFGTAKFAAQESETTRGNARAQRERTRRFNDRTFVMWKHLKLGVADNTRDSIRVHFEWEPDYGTIIVGHCGAHLYLP